jgi:hypothetical protein
LRNFSFSEINSLSAKIDLLKIPKFLHANSRTMLASQEPETGPGISNFTPVTSVKTIELSAVDREADFGSGRASANKQLGFNSLAPIAKI